MRRPRWWKAGGDGGRPLTRREREVLSLLADGATTPEVAERLGISMGAVQRILRKRRGGQ